MTQPAAGTPACEHPNFTAVVHVARLTRSDDDPTVTGYSASITTACADCGEPFRWLGLPIGLNPAAPTCSFDGTELRAPLYPANAEAVVLSGPGYSIRGVR